MPAVRRVEFSSEEQGRLQRLLKSGTSLVQKPVWVFIEAAVST